MNVSENHFKGDPSSYWHTRILVIMIRVISVAFQKIEHMQYIKRKFPLKGANSTTHEVTSSTQARIARGHRGTRKGQWVWNKDEKVRRSYNIFKSLDTIFLELFKGELFIQRNECTVNTVPLYLRIPHCLRATLHAITNLTPTLHGPFYCYRTGRPTILSVLTRFIV